MKNLLTILVILLFVACKHQSESKSDLISEKVPISKLPDSVQNGIDSLIVSIGKTNTCRVMIKAGKMGEIGYYSGYDGRVGAAITDFTSFYEIGSTSKLFTASAILQLIEQDKLSLDDKLVDLLPHDTWYKGLLVVSDTNYIDEVRLVNLLNHTSGFADYFRETDEEEIKLHGKSDLQFTADDLVALTKLNSKNTLKPNLRFQYSNLNYIFLGLIIEKYAGMGYQGYVQQHILDPLGMKNTYFGSKHRPAALAKGHYHQVEVEMPYTMAGSAGEIISTLDDMEIFVNAWYDGEIFEKPETARTIQTMYYHDMGLLIKYGLGVVNLLDKSWGHAGQTFGYASYAGRLPNGYSFEIAIDDAGVDVWMPAIGLTGILGVQ
ncbi:MAG: serine hydrolase domain-containing protein [Lutimonas sp.]